MSAERAMEAAEVTLSPKAYLRKIQTSSVYNVVEKTPLEYAPLLSKATKASVWLKREDLQPVRSFKLRGAYNKMSQLSHEELEKGVVAASAGNHAQGVAYAARLLGVQATIVVPQATPTIKADAIREMGAELILYGNNYDEAFAHAQLLCQETGRPMIHPYDDPEVIAGQGTIGLEIDRQHSGNIEAVFVPVGGGGLICGIALALKQLRPGVKIIGVEASDGDAMAQSLAAGHRVVLPRVGLFADGCAVRKVGEHTFELAREWVDEIVVVSNDEICAAVKKIFEDRRAIVEPAGALGYAGLKKWASDHASNGDLIAVLSGANMNFERLQFVAERARVGNHTEAIFAIHIPERPGAFLDLCLAFGNRNLTEFNYRYADPNRAIVFAGLSVKNSEDAESVLSSLKGAGFDAVDLTGDEVAKLHVRHMVGGRSAAADERVFRVLLAERAGALADFLQELAGRWNISLFHYRNHGADRGRVLVGFQVPPATEAPFNAFIESLGDSVEEETHSPAVRLFLSGGDAS